MKRLGVWIAAALLSLPAVAFDFLGGPKGGPEQDRGRDARPPRIKEVKLGAVLPMSGVVASDGIAAMQGIRIAEADLNARGDLPFKVKFLLEDGKFEPKVSLDAFNRLVSREVAGMLLIGDNTCQMTKAQVKKRELPTIASMTVTERSVKGNPWMYRSWPPIATSARLIAHHMAKSAGVRSAAVFHIDAMYGLESVKTFEPAFAALGGRITAKESFPFLAADLRPQIAKLLRSAPEAVFVTGFGQGLITAVNQLREGGYAGTIYTDTAVVDPRVKKNLSSLAGIVFAGNAFDEECAKGGAAAAFERKYRELEKEDIGGMPPQAPFAYVAAQVLVHGLAEACGSKAEVPKAIGRIRELTTILGPVSYREDGEIRLPLYVKTFGADGRNRLLDDALWKTLE